MSVVNLFAFLTSVLMSLLQAIHSQGPARTLMNYQHTINRSVFYNDNVLLSLESMFPRLDKDLNYDASVPQDQRIFQHKRRFVKLNETADTKQLQNCYGVQRKNASTYFTCCFSRAEGGSIQVNIAQVTFRVPTREVRLEVLNLTGYLLPSQLVVDFVWNEKSQSLYVLTCPDKTQGGDSQVVPRNMRLISVDFWKKQKNIKVLDFTMCTNVTTEYIPNFGLQVQPVSSQGKIPSDTNQSVLIISDYALPDTFMMTTIVHNYRYGEISELTLKDEVYSSDHYSGEVEESYKNCSLNKSLISKAIYVPKDCLVKELVPTGLALIVNCVRKDNFSTTMSHMSLFPCQFGQEGDISCSVGSRKNVSSYTDRYRSEDKDYRPTSIAGVFYPLEPENKANPANQTDQAVFYMITQEAVFKIRLNQLAADIFEFEMQKKRIFTNEKRFTFAKPIHLSLDRHGSVVAVVESKSGFKYPMVTNFDQNTTRVYREKIFGDLVQFFYDDINDCSYLVAISIPNDPEEVLSFGEPQFYQDYERDIMVAYFDKLPMVENRYMQVKGKLVTDDMEGVLNYEFMIYPSADFMDDETFRAFQDFKVYGSQLEAAQLSGQSIEVPYEQTKLSGNGYKFTGSAAVSRDNMTRVEISDETIAKVNFSELIPQFNLTKQILCFEKYLLCLLNNTFVLLEPIIRNRVPTSKIIGFSPATQPMQLSDYLLDFIAFKKYPNSDKDDTVILIMFWQAEVDLPNNQTRVHTRAAIYTISRRKTTQIHFQEWDQKVIKVDLVPVATQLHAIGLALNKFDPDNPSAESTQYLFQFKGTISEAGGKSPFPATLDYHDKLNKPNSQAVDFYREKAFGSMVIHRILLEDPNVLPTLEGFVFYKQRLSSDDQLVIDDHYQFKIQSERYRVLCICEESVLLLDIAKRLIKLRTVVIDSKIGPWEETSVLPTPDVSRFKFAKVFGKVLYLSFSPDLLIVYDISTQGAINALKRVIGEYKLSFPFSDDGPDGTELQTKIENIYFPEIAVNRLDNSFTSVGLYMGILKRNSLPSDTSGNVKQAEILYLSTHRPKIVMRIFRNDSLATKTAISGQLLKREVDVEINMTRPSFLSTSNSSGDDVIIQRFRMEVCDYNSRLVAKVYKHKALVELQKYASQLDPESLEIELLDLIATTSPVLRYKVEQPPGSKMFSVTQILKMLPDSDPIYSSIPRAPLFESDLVDISDNFTIVIKQDRIEITSRNQLSTEDKDNPKLTTIKFENKYQYTLQKYPSEGSPYWLVMACTQTNYSQTHVELIVLSRDDPSSFARVNFPADFPIQATASLGVATSSNSKFIRLILCQNATSALVTTLEFATIRLNFTNPSKGLKSGLTVAKIDPYALLYDIEYELINTKFFYLEGELIMVSPIKYSAYVLGIVVEIDVEHGNVSVNDPMLTRLDAVSNTGSSNMSILIDEKNLEIKIISFHEIMRTMLTIHSVRFSLDREGDQRFYSKLEHTLPWPKGFNQELKFRYSSELLLARTSKQPGVQFYFIYSLAESRIVGSLTHEDVPGITASQFNQCKLFMLRAQRAIYINLPNHSQNYVMEFYYPKLLVHSYKSFDYKELSDYKLVMLGLEDNSRVELPINTLLQLQMNSRFGIGIVMIGVGIIVVAIASLAFLIIYKYKPRKYKKNGRSRRTRAPKAGEGEVKESADSSRSESPKKEAENEGSSLQSGNDYVDHSLENNHSLSLSLSLRQHLTTEDGLRK